MERRHKRISEGKKKRSIEEDDADDEWPEMPPGHRILTTEEHELQRRKESKISQDVEMTEAQTAADMLNDMHMAANGDLLSSFPQDFLEDSGDGEVHEAAILSVFDDNSISPPPCPIVVDTVPDDDDSLLFPRNS